MANQLTKIPKFRRCVLQNFPFIEQDFDALTDYELLCKVVEYLNKVIANENSLTESQANLINQFNTLKYYVDNYFDNLDVQEEINNKLDEMAEAGIFQEIITTYIQSNVAWTFDTVADMKQATNLVDGSYARTLGFHTVNDGGGAIYYITDSGTADDGAIIAIGSLRAHLINNGHVVPEQFGAYGDGTHDDVLAIRKAMDFLYSVDNNVTTWQTMGTLYFNAKTYLVNSSIIDSNYPNRVTRIMFKGDGTRSAIVCGSSCNVLFDNNNKIGFSNFEDIYFIGNDGATSKFLYTDGSQPQRLRFERCSINHFHTVCDVQGSVDNSEFVFNQCSIAYCGSVETPAELFIFNNAQAVNWRFYATDIESFVGTCFHFLKGTAINYFQGSIIPINTSTVFSYNNGDANAFGPGNFPTATMYGVRYELRNDSILIDNGNFPRRIIINHIGCGMGGQNLSGNSACIRLVSCIPKLTFDSCYNFDNYNIDLEMNSSIAANETYDGYIKFNNCEYEVVTAAVNRSTISASTASYYRTLPTIFYNGQPIIGVSRENLAKYSGQILQKNMTLLTNYNSSSDGTGVVTYMPRAGYVNEVVLESVYSTNYGSSTTLTAEIYNENNSLIGSGTITVQSRSKQIIQINAPVTTGWYVKLKHTYGTGQTLPIPHILYAEYLS